MTALDGTKIQDTSNNSVYNHIEQNNCVLLICIVLCVCTCFALFESFESLKNGILSLKLFKCKHTLIFEVLDLLELL